MKKIFVLVSILVNIQIWAQVTEYPKVGSQQENVVKLYKIDVQKDQTILYFKHTAPSYYTDGGWVSIKRETYILDKTTQKKLKLVKAVGIPYSPEKYYCKKAGEVLYFRLIFPAVSSTCTKIDMIECDPQTNTISTCWNFFNIQFNHEQEIVEVKPERSEKEYNSLAYYLQSESKWSDGAKGINVVVFNSNENGDMEINFADGQSEILRKSKTNEPGKDNEGNYKSATYLDGNNREVIVQIYDNGNVKLIYPDRVILLSNNN